MSMNYVEEMNTKILFPLNKGCKKIRNSIRKQIREARRNYNINLIVTDVTYVKAHLIVTLSGEKISKLEKILGKGKWIPKKLTLVEVLNFQDDVRELIRLREKQFYRQYNRKYEISLVSQNMSTEEEDTLVILLAEKI